MSGFQDMIQTLQLARVEAENNHQDSLNAAALTNVQEVLAHQRELRVIEIEIAQLNLDRAKAELETQKIIKDHVVDAEKAARFTNIANNPVGGSS